MDFLEELHRCPQGRQSAFRMDDFLLKKGLLVERLKRKSQIGEIVAAPLCPWTRVLRSPTTPRNSAFNVTKHRSGLRVLKARGSASRDEAPSIHRHTLQRILRALGFSPWKLPLFLLSQFAVWIDDIEGCGHEMEGLCGENKSSFLKKNIKNQPLSLCIECCGVKH
jgi:hypothetical protein